MAEVANEIGGFAKAIEERKAAAAKQSQPVPSPLQGLGSLFGPATTNFIVGGIERISPAAESARATPMVAISGLPGTAYERLVGRGAELERLDEAWRDGKSNILSLIAEGGAGKSALVNEWLTRLQADVYRGADCVLGWSFYSQGSKERATAADEFLNWALAKLDVKIETTSASAKGEVIAEADEAAGAPGARWRRAVATRAGPAARPTQGPGRKELDVARKLIAECGYHRRDEELAELDEVIAGGGRFADLPPRV
jgi:hypothetical protein